MVSCETCQGGSSGCMRIVAPTCYGDQALVHQGADLGKQGRIDLQLAAPSATPCLYRLLGPSHVVAPAYRIAPDLPLYRRGRPIARRLSPWFRQR